MKKHIILALSLLLLTPNQLLAYSPDFYLINLSRGISKLLLYIALGVSVYFILKLLRYRKIVDLQERQRKTRSIIIKMVLTIFIFASLSIAAYVLSQDLSSNICSSSFGC